MIIPKEIDYLLQKEKRKDAKLRILKIYNALVYKKGKNKNYFDCPSSYLIKSSPRYNKVIKLFIDNGIIEYYSNKEVDVIGNDLFQPITTRRKKYYNTENGHCVKYKFIIDITKGYEYNLDMDYKSLYDNENWYHKTKYSLLQLGFPIEQIKISRDNFSRRLHTNVTGFIEGYDSYRNLLSGGEYYAIDSKTSQPRLLWLKMKDMGLQDDNLNKIFDNDLDFYDFIIDRIPALQNGTREDRRLEAKELFASWVNGTGYLEEDRVEIRNIFPVANMLIKNYKTLSYKNICKYLQYTESSIFIDDLLNNVPVDFCLTIHDSLIVKKEDSQKVLEWCIDRKPELKFELDVVKPKK